MAFYLQRLLFGLLLDSFQSVHRSLIDVPPYIRGHQSVNACKMHVPESLEPLPIFAEGLNRKNPHSFSQAFQVARFNRGTFWMQDLFLQDFVAAKELSQLAINFVAVTRNDSHFLGSVPEIRFSFGVRNQLPNASSRRVNVNGSFYFGQFLFLVRLYRVKFLFSQKPQCEKKDFRFPSRLTPPIFIPENGSSKKAILAFANPKGEEEE